MSQLFQCQISYPRFERLTIKMHFQILEVFPRIQIDEFLWCEQLFMVDCCQFTVNWSTQILVKNESVVIHVLQFPFHLNDSFLPPLEFLVAK